LKFSWVHIFLGHPVQTVHKNTQQRSDRDCVGPKHTLCYAQVDCGTAARTA